MKDRANSTTLFLRFAAKRRGRSGGGDRLLASAMPAVKDEEAVAVIELMVGGEGDTFVVNAGVAKATVEGMEKPVLGVSQEFGR